MNLIKHIYILFFFNLFFGFVTNTSAQTDKASQPIKVQLSDDPLLFRYLPPKVSPIPQTYHIKSLPFFCRMEARLNKKVNIPIRFRLGSMELIDELEGKRKN